MQRPPIIVAVLAGALCVGALASCVRAPDQPAARGLDAVALRLTTSLEACGSIGGCAADIALEPEGGGPVKPTRLNTLGGLTQGLPASVPPGRYRVVVHQIALGDAIYVVEGPRGERIPSRDEWPLATCTATLDATGVRSSATATAEVRVTFSGQSCEIEIAITERAA